MRFRGPRLLGGLIGLLLGLTTKAFIRKDRISISMKLVFLGTRGYIKDRTPAHYMHSSLSVSYRGKEIIIDCGEDWLGKIDGWHPRAILVTHAHPDHSWGLKKGAPCPVYTTSESWDVISNFKIEHRKTLAYREPVVIAGMTVETFAVEHSTRAPAAGYRITAGKRSLFYAPDLVYIHDRQDALEGIDVYIGDGATIARPMVRKRGESLIGHVPIQTQLTWCKKEVVPEAVFSHCGSQIVTGDEKAVTSRISTLAQERGVHATIAYDGMELSFR